MPRTTDSQSYVHFKDNWILSPQGERCVKIRNINNNKYTTMNNLTLVEQKTALTEEFGGKNLVFHVRKNGVSIIENYTIIDRSQSDVKDVFDILNSSLLSQKIVITHNLDFAYALKDFKVLFLQKGSLKFFGSHSEFFIQENLNRFYGENLKLLDSHLVLDL